MSQGMGREDWYRGPVWDLATRAHFEEKLSRARTQRAQYLLIKGCGLTEADDRSVWAAGRELLQRVLDEHPGDKQCVISAHHDLGWSLAREGADTEAAHHYEQSLALQRHPRAPSFDPGTRLILAELIVDAGWEHRYGEAVDLLGEFVSSRPGGLFPDEHFRLLLVEARIAERLGRTDIARRDAERALELYAKNESVFPRHPGVGVISTGTETVRELERMANLD
jgi:Flp pilus assembly protein TadD